jgi:hypothetical protein
VALSVPKRETSNGRVAIGITNGKLYRQSPARR